jgi:hypothetical protein
MCSAHLPLSSSDYSVINTGLLKYGEHCSDNVIQLNDCVIVNELEQMDLNHCNVSVYSSKLISSQVDYAQHIKEGHVLTKGSETSDNCGKSSTGYI